MAKGDPCRACGVPSIARELCQKHYKRWNRHGHADQTRPADWGKRRAHPLYKLWCGMRQRCESQKAKDYPNYGGRGVIVDPRWLDFWAFVEDMGPRPSPEHSVDRRDTYGPYSPENCRWATYNEQNRNKRSSVIFEPQAREIKRRLQRGERSPEIAREMSLHYDHVRNVAIGRSWGDVAP